MAKRAKGRQRGVRKGKQKGRAGRPPRPNRRGRRTNAGKMDEEEKFTYQGTFTQKDDDDPQSAASN